jgi:hypothetical protein
LDCESAAINIGQENRLISKELIIILNKIRGKNLKPSLIFWSPDSNPERVSARSVPNWRRKLENVLY